ncbi:hypothetical protein CW304_19540 [Bacillus sp. UFRGS-B20]|nr:hypothetical protein CW304_19540 [Bacillus sp. UFRGS-B20]
MVSVKHKKWYGSIALKIDQQSRKGYAKRFFAYSFNSYKKNLKMQNNLLKFTSETNLQWDCMNHLFSAKWDIDE